MRYGILIGVLFLGGCTTTSTDVSSKTLNASWYMHGKKTANGERFNPQGMTAAHRTMPFGTKLKLHYQGRSVIVRINDRGPFVRGKQLDLSRGAAQHLGCIRAGSCRVSYEVIK